MYDLVIEFFNHPFFIIVGALSTIVMIITFCYTIYLIIKGVLPVWYRLGMGLSKRRIAIFTLSNYTSLKDMLVDSKIFDGKNVVEINKDNLKKAEDINLFLVHWMDFKDKLDEILAMKKDSAALVVYAPQDEGRIDDVSMKKINSHRNAIVVNFRGRLINDILTSLITTSYDR